MSEVEPFAAAAVVWPSGSVRAAGEWAALDAALSEAAGSVPCREGDAELWWDPTAELEAASGCRVSCPAVGECLAYAVAAGERYGVWGAATPGERRAMRGGS